MKTSYLHASIVVLCLASAGEAQAWELAFQAPDRDSATPVFMNIGTVQSVFPKLSFDTKEEIRADRLKPAAKVQTRLVWASSSNPLSPHTLPGLVLSNPFDNTIRVTLGRCKFESAHGATEATNTLTADIPEAKEVFVTFAGIEPFRVRGVDGKPVKWSCSTFSVQNL